MKRSDSGRKFFVLQRLLYLWLLAPLLALPAYAEEDDQTWNTWSHNGSTMYLEWNGRLRNIYYLDPRQGLASRGVSRGTLLFSGTRDDFNYTGTAYVFSRCGPVAYQVSGSLSSDLKHISLQGKAPIVDDSCHIGSYRDDVLDFNASDDDDCGCQCPSEIPVADYDEYNKNGIGTSCPYLYAWSERDRNWTSYGKVIHVAQGRHRETVEEVKLKEFSTRFRLAEEEPENSFIDKVELRVETDDAVYALKPNLKRLAARDGVYMFIPAYKNLTFTFDLPTWVDRARVRNSTLVVTGYYERVGLARSAQCVNRNARRASR